MLTHQSLTARIRTAYGGTLPQSMVLFGIRVPYDPKKEQVDRWVDLVGWWTPTESKWYTATTRPGLVWLQKPMNAAGTGILVPGVYRQTYALGLHGPAKNNHRAFIQVRPVSVWRDRNRDAVWDTNGQVSTGLFGINIHRANVNSLAASVGLHSAGCQVVRSIQSFTEMLQRAEASRQKAFDYVLMEFDPFPNT